ncbi:hypothetical protein K3N28_14935 [Glycomyces sp. TRM65418]|uniref:hypothetical protein n=1 Tax=Glycomyces sp. TRM65418 TaxID=2867006 RepID=UPI001CE66A29|nr:hypothetical protein [Glycomyces sp. TRM65418]MCC3764359.1 hypothetical protein [Glycomyces sp. TRM65418]QZD54038.1 hypothetical protein K3N28_14860 [Glycomyces sp. TRM65418]
MNRSHESAHARPDAHAGALRRCVDLGVVAHADAGTTGLTDTLAAAYGIRVESPSTTVVRVERLVRASPRRLR